MRVWTYLLIDLTHGEVLVITGACHSDVLEPAAGPGLLSIHTELPAVQVLRDLPGKRENQESSEAPCVLEPTHSVFAQQRKVMIMEPPVYTDKSTEANMPYR